MFLFSHRPLTCPLFDRYFSNTMLTNSTAPPFRFINPMLAESSDVLAESLGKSWSHDDSNGMLPDYALRHMYESEMLRLAEDENKFVDPRVQAYSYVLLEGESFVFEVEMKKKYIHGPAQARQAARRALGGQFRMKFSWQARMRDQPDQPRMGALFRSISGSSFDYASDDDGDA